ncbi:MAG TPA: hypothetical protein VFB71_10940 [Ramlibacter sp.]|nr:hypothetical protein [Ramlibacter sp.]
MRHSFPVGLLAGGTVVALVLAGWLATRGPAPDTHKSPVGPGPVRSEAASSTAATATMAAAAAAPAACAFDPLLQRQGAQDGRFEVDAALATAADSPPSAFVAVAREAAGEGRARDAEVALIVACRLTARGAPPPSVPISNVLGLLGQHYVSTAAAAQADELRDALLARGRELLDGSAQGYTAVLGAGSARSRQATQRLAALQQREDALSQGASMEQRDGELGAEESQGACAGGRRFACDDADLQQMESDLRRLRAQVESVSRDPAGVRRRAAEAEARRDACRDRACVARWYAQRRSQLLAEF